MSISVLAVVDFMSSQKAATSFLPSPSSAMTRQDNNKFWHRLSAVTLFVSMPAIYFSLYTLLQATVQIHEPFPPALPSEKHLEITFREQKKLENISSSMDESWSSMLSTPKGGFLWRPYNETTNEAWGVTMFHSIHCLGLIRGFVQERLNMTNPKHKHGHGHSGDDIGHIGHCFSYIAQVSKSHRYHCLRHWLILGSSVPTLRW